MDRRLIEWLEGSTGMCLLVGRTGCGKTYMLKKALEKTSDKFHEISLACPENQIGPIAYLQKRLIMKDVTAFALKTKPVYTIDSLDTMLAGDKTIISDLLKLVKAYDGFKKTKLVLVASDVISKRLNELRKICHIIEIGDRTEVAGENVSTIDSFAYTFPTVMDPRLLQSFLMSDVWLAPLTAVDEVSKELDKKRQHQCEFLRRVLQWGKIMSKADTDDFFFQDLSSIAITFFVCFLMWFYKTKGVAASGGGVGQFTHLLTLHSVRKRTWKEKYESGLPWNSDPQYRLGAKFSANTVDALWTH